MREMGNRKDDMPVHDLKSCTRNDNPGSTRQRNNNNNFNNNKEHSVNEEYNNSNEPVQCFKCKGYGHLARVCPSGDGMVQGRRNRGRGSARGNRGGRSRGRGRGRRYHVNEVTENQEYEEQYDEQFQDLMLDSITVETVSERGRSPLRNAEHCRSRRRSRRRAHKGEEERFEAQFESLNSVAVESITGRTGKQRFARFRFHNFKKKNYTTGALKVDSGAGVNTLPTKEYQRLYPERFTADGAPIQSYLKQDEDTLNTKLKGYGGQYVKHHGKVVLPCEYNGKKFMCSFFLADVDGPPLMGLPTGEALGIIKIITADAVSDEDEQEEESTASEGTTYVDPSVPVSSRPNIQTKADLKVMYPECFETNKRCFPGLEYEFRQ